MHMFHFITNYQTAFKSSCTTLHSLQEVQILPSLQPLVLSVFFILTSRLGVSCISCISLFSFVFSWWIMTLSIFSRAYWPNCVSSFMESLLKFVQSAMEEVIVSNVIRTWKRGGCPCVHSCVCHVVFGTGEEGRGRNCKIQQQFIEWNLIRQLCGIRRSSHMCHRLLKADE